MLCKYKYKWKKSHSSRKSDFLHDGRSYGGYGLADSHHGFAMVLTYYGECC